MALLETTASLLLLHNPRCAKSRAALALLEQRGVDVEVRRYLDQPLTPAELRELRRRLARPVAEWIRTGESAYRQSGLGPRSSEEEMFAALAAHPVLLERPIAIRGKHAVVGRPPENVLELVDDDG
jgi:arsenate reductase